MSLLLDHILVGAPDLEPAVTDFAAATGVTPCGGGSHPGFGTRNQLLSMGEDLFFEIIAPDPAQTESGHRAEALARLSAPCLHAYCLRTDDIATVSERAVAAGIGVTDPISMSRTRADGVQLNWEILYFDAPEWGDALPFMIDWKGSPHPATTAPGGATLIDFTVLHPNAADLSVIHEALGIPVPVALSPWPGFLLRLDTPQGEVVLT